jgi:hypothetical protein
VGAGKMVGRLPAGEIKPKTGVTKSKQGALLSRVYGP